MASWADQISQFNPYIQQLPIEAMTQVGMYKQQKYDEGIQKVQSYIDNVAGLDVVKPIQKAYLQTKLNELGSKLKTVAAGDFSNYQLVNSVGGMANQIVKDPTIQGALSDTQIFRKGQQDLETARKAGKNSIQNEAWWNKTTNDWMNDGSLDTRFNGRYVEYRDMEKKLRDVAKEVHEYDKSVEIPFKRDNQGNVLYFYQDAKGKKIATTNPSSGGKAEIDEAILKTRVKGKSAEKILENFYMSLDEDDKQQLGIDGWYHYRNYTGDGFKSKIKQDIISSFDDRKKSVSDEIVRLTVELSDTKKFTAEQINAKKVELAKYTQLSSGGGLDKQLAEKLASIDNLDELSLKQSVYTEKTLNGLANAIAYQDLETEIKSNPYFAAEMDKRKLQFDYWKENERNKRADRDYFFEVRKQEFAEGKALAETRGKDYIWEYGGLGTDRTIPTLVDLEKGINQITREKDEFIKANALTILGSDASNLTTDQLRKAMDQKLREHIQNPSIVSDNDVRDLLNRYRTMDVDLTTRQQHYNYISKISNDKYDKVLDTVFEGRTGIVDKEGKRIYTAKELYNVLNDMKPFVKYQQTSTVPVGIGGLSPTQGTVSIAKVDTEGLLSKFRGTKHQLLAEAYAKKMTGKPLSDREALYLNKALSVDEDVKTAVQGVYKEKRNYEAEQIGKLMPQYQRVVTSINMEDKTDKESVESLIGNMYGIYSKLGGLDTENFNPNTISEWRSSKGAKEIKYILDKTEDDSGATLRIMKGDEIQEIPLNAQQLATYFPKSVRRNFMDNIKYVIQSSPEKTTNAMSKRGDPLNARFTGEMLPLFSGTGLAQLVRFDIEGAKTNDGGPNDGYQIRMYVNDNGVWKSDIVNQQGFATFGGVQEVLRNIGLNEYERIKNKP